MPAGPWQSMAFKRSVAVMVSFLRARTRDRNQYVREAARMAVEKFLDD